MPAPYCLFGEHQFDRPIPVHTGAPEGFTRWLRACNRCDRVFQRDFRTGSQPTGDSVVRWSGHDRNDYPQSAWQQVDALP